MNLIKNIAIGLAIFLVSTGITYGFSMLVLTIPKEGSWAISLIVGTVLSIIYGCSRIDE
jgi:uncharacterized transporter YbjL